MKSGRLLPLSALCLSACFASMAHAVVTVNYYLWTGIGNGWKNQATPPADGSAALVFDHSVRNVVPFFGDFTANSFHFLEEERFRFVSSTPGSPLNVTINNGVDAAEADFTRFDFSPDLTIHIAQNQTWNLGNSGTATIHGRLASTGDLTILASGGAALILDNRTSNPAATPSTYSGHLTISAADAQSFPTLAIWGHESIGTGPVSFTNGGSLSLHGQFSLANDFNFSTGALFGGQSAHAPIRFRVWEAPTAETGRLTGDITLVNHTTFQIITGFQNKLDSHLPNNTGVLPLPGPATRHPLVIDGSIGDGGNARGLHVTGPGVLLLNGTNTYSGGTYVGFPVAGPSGQGGSLVFGSLDALPGTGTIQSGLLNSNNAGGYIGIAASAVDDLSFASSFLARIDKASSGSVGLDTLPGQATQVFDGDIDLANAGFNSTTTNGIRFGTATSLILGPNSTLFPQIYNRYHFGNGGGTLFVQTALDDKDGPNQLILSNVGPPLKVVLQGDNTYTGDTTVANGILVFDDHPSLPDIRVFRAGGASNFVGQSYIGMGGGVDLSASSFLGLFDKPNTWGIIGFDGRSEDSVDLTGFNDGVYLGTASTATLTGTITPSTVTNGDNTANTLRFTAADGGTLTVDSVLADLQLDPPTALSVVIGVPVPPPMARMSDGSVVLNGVNTYTGGTTINASGGITVVAGDDSAFGTGAVTFAANGGLLGLAAGTSGITLGNNLVFQTPGQGGGVPVVTFTGLHDFTLAGDISGPDWTNMTGRGALQVIDEITVTLSGTNTNFHGDFLLGGDGKLRFENNAAAGKAILRFNGAGGVASFNESGNAMNPVLYGIEGEDGTVHLTAGTNLTFNLDNPDGDYDFGGVITGSGGPVNASLTLTGTDIEDGEDFLYLYGNNQYTGGTTITGYSAMALGHNNAAGSGPITINATEGGLALNSNVTLTNPLTLTAGGLAGLGTFAPSSFNGNVGGPIVIGANNVVLPGIPSDMMLPGTLTFATNTVFQDGGAYQWLIVDPTDPDAFSLLNISGTLDLTTLSPGGFMLALESVGPDGDDGEPFAPSIIWGQPYTLRIISASGGVLGFEATDFSFDVSNFQLGQVPLQNFSVTADTNNVYLNFTAVPEPSTWALMITGAAFLGLTWYRRRRVS